ncbi:vitelline membrane protein Vm26Ab-like [Glossina fuscipes]|uniref:Vitelline membrane protein Vm26Ab-like n=1 Tax=Glossina fuscipes TaxID=7396 RepID=A0A9C5YYQ1_9MUSC|nr:vitelline membrane protein Vm26Ab-like [Glossina fuscipes]KAI9581346.1 hypothetical protein GQX74_012671 [Glossina fuscipes]
MYKFIALCLMSLMFALAAAKPGVVAPLAYSAPVVAAAPYTAAYTAAYTAPYYAAYSSPYVAAPYAAAPYAAAYTSYPYAASYLLRK